MAISHDIPVFSTYKKPATLVSDITWDTQRHSIMIGGTTIKLTATEYRLLFPLRHQTPVTYANLVWMAYQCPFDEKVRMMIDKHVDRIRSKLRESGIYIYCVTRYGYMLLPKPPRD
jgi:DNA-binding response OmpR family regulator